MDKKETFAGEVVKRLPMEKLYDDLLHSALSTVGEGLQGVTKIALAPISILVWGYDQVAEWLQKELPSYFERKKIKKEKVVTPDEAIAVPTIEALRYNLKKEELRNMFTNLLGHR